MLLFEGKVGERWFTLDAQRAPSPPRVLAEDHECYVSFCLHAESRIYRCSLALIQSLPADEKDWNVFLHRIVDDANTHLVARLTSGQWHELTVQPRGSMTSQQIRFRHLPDFPARRYQ